MHFNSGEALIQVNDDDFHERIVSFDLFEFNFIFLLCRLTGNLHTAKSDQFSFKHDFSASGERKIKLRKYLQENYSLDLHCSEQTR